MVNNNSKSAKGNILSQQTSSPLDVTSANDEPEIVTYIFDGPNLVSYHNENKRSEFNQIEAEFKKAYNNANLEHASVMRHNNEFRLKIRTSDKMTKAVLENQKSLKALLGGLTLQD